MRIGATIALLTIISHLGSAQDSSLLTSYLEPDVSQEMVLKVERLLQKVRSKQAKSDHELLRSLFRITHRQLLKQYEQYSSFGDIFQAGKYDCLTATALFGVLLTDFGYNYSTIETDHHIFILVHSSEGDVLFESTDPLNGFENHPEEIKTRIAEYHKRKEEVSGMYKKVSPMELVGLLYYNQSVKEFNNQNWTEALSLSQSAQKYYISPRIRELENLLINVITKINSYRPANQSVVTSNR